MFKRLIFLLSILLCTSCIGQKIEKAQRVVEENATSEKIEVFLRKKNFEIVSSAKVIIAYDIKKNLIEGTNDEYSNKVFFKDTLDSNRAEKLLAYIKNDASYEWAVNETYNDFNPTRQFLIRNETQRIFLLLNENSNHLGFVNLDGQKVVKLSSDFINFLNDL